MNPEVLINRAKEVVGEFELSEGYSAGCVGSALMTKSGNVYTGICIDLACGIGFCAEHAAIAEMLKARETEIEMIVAVCEERILPPCGRCREMIVQVNPNNAHTKVIVAEDSIMTLDELLPVRWM
ncbi:MAG: cytidine deaminase [Candidatus Thermoplasmatota archaeon]|nr:cytidine deaminase [Euryarchaeota archaeon]MBU4031203.1 cytidine deaminase [Candidatus Thermoplasmatota archaeon]MBU4070609.1 cytidine deaminase [Candidatus Thermoplasmatota archaeon]MBU4143436.1 cytidine deaminase [Candidatus Thermoplasmatota archaeon]MBU4592626.1 cytidine deaminase [Candidatus Thermoplasmatota archaeon]